MMHVGVAGAGKMGSAIARNLLERGYQVSVWNRDPGPAEELVAAGALRCDDVPSLVESVDAVIAMLWDDDVAREISLGLIVPAARKGQLVIESSTLSPQMYETLAEAAAQRELDFLACPVVGSIDSARAGTLTLFPGGSEAAFDRACELLHALGSTITFTGSPAASGILKLASNAVLGVMADSIGELLDFAERGGVDRTLVIDTLVHAFERVSGKRQQLVDRDTQPRFSAAALLKDLRLAKAARQRLGVEAPVMDSVLAEFESRVASGLGDRDYIAVALAIEQADRVQRRE
jgi:3-hydroxyisobutyrate dehydrogenase